MDREHVKQILQKEFDAALKEWADTEARRGNPMMFKKSVSRHTPDIADVKLGHCEGVKRVADRLGVELENDNLSEQRLHEELVKRDAFDH
jgi:hypothetical protein